MFVLDDRCARNVGQYSDSEWFLINFTGRRSSERRGIVSQLQAPLANNRQAPSPFLKLKVRSWPHEWEVAMIER
jgi:hypothetical protein